jgi:hypothetical protein
MTDTMKILLAPTNAAGQHEVKIVPLNLFFFLSEVGGDGKKKDISDLCMYVYGTVIK